MRHKRKEKGDGVTTTGGIVGRVASIKEDTVVIETAGAKIRIKRWAVADVEKLSVE
ncbi:MAG: preprotein translocase subunit YajC [Oscillospiraceae bacterium]